MRLRRIVKYPKPDAAYPMVVEEHDVLRGDTVGCAERAAALERDLQLLEVRFVVRAGEDACDLHRVLPSCRTMMRRAADAIPA